MKREVIRGGGQWFPTWGEGYSTPYLGNADDCFETRLRRIGWAGKDK